MQTFDEKSVIGVHMLHNGMDYKIQAYDEKNNMFLCQKLSAEYGSLVPKPGTLKFTPEEVAKDFSKAFGQKYAFKKSEKPIFTKDSLKNDLAKKKAAEKDIPSIPSNEKKQEQSL